MNEEQNETWGELIKFAILVGVLVVVVIVVLLTRPLIFERIVPAVIGLDGVDVPVVEEEAIETTATAVPQPPPLAEPTEADTSPPETSLSTDLTSAEPPQTEEIAPPTNEMPLSIEETTADVTYTIQAGDTLYNIARRYGTTIEAIIAANEALTSPKDIIQAGMELAIPTDR